MAEQGGVSFLQFSEGALLDNADVRVKTARFNRWDYKGKVKEPVLALQLLLIDKGPEGKEYEEQLSAGELKFFVPSGDGHVAMPVSSHTALNKNTNCAQFLISLFNAASSGGAWLAEFQRTGNVAMLDGLEFHLVRKAQPKRPGIVNPEALPGQEAVVEREKTYPTVANIIAYPAFNGSAPASAPAAAAAPAPTQAAPAAAAPAAAAPSGGGLVDAMEVAIILRGIVEANGNSIKKTAVAGKAFSNPEVKGMDGAKRNALLGMVVNDAFLGGEAVTNMGLKYDAASQTVSVV